MVSTLNRSMSRPASTTRANRLASLRVYKGRAVVASAWITVWLVIAGFSLMGPGLFLLAPVLLFSTVGLVSEAHAYAERQREGE